MGIDGLWKILEPGSERHSLRDYALTESLKHHGIEERPSLNPIVVGVDASIWMNETQAAFHHRRHAQMGENPELRTLFYRLAHLLDICMVPVFVFDGPSRPSKKRGKKVITQPHWLTPRFQDLIRLFGFYSHTAPGEAEAELAVLNRHGVFDAIMTEDSDAFVFGATCVIRKSDNKAKSDEVRIYTKERVQRELELQQNDLVFMAVLCGGDYDKAGLAGCGTAISAQLARLRMGDTFCDATRLPAHEQENTFQTCRTTLRAELTTNTSGYLNRQHPRLAEKIQDTFPPIDTLQRYVSPIVSEMHFLDAAVWISQMPNVGGMFRICEELFGWGTAAEILKKFKSVVWTGVCSRQLIHFQLNYDLDFIIIPQSSFLSAKAPARPRQSSSVEQYDVKVNLQSAISSSLNFLHYSRQSVSDHHKISLINTYATFTARIPVLVVRCALPDLPQKSKSTKSKRVRVTKNPRLDQDHEVIDLTL